VPAAGTVPAEPEAQAHFWVERNVARWQEVLERERHDGLAVVDTDPLKLHFVWSLLRTGQAGELEWTMYRDFAREAFAAERYALADIFLVADVDEATLRARRDADPLRTRGNFEQHVRLRDSLLRWYAVIDRLEPGRVVFGLPPEGLTRDLLAKGRRRERSGALLFDRLMRELAAL
jgi:hypothetical protein